MSWYSPTEREEQREDFKEFQKESDKAFEYANKQLAAEHSSYVAPRYPWHPTESDFSE